MKVSQQNIAERLDISISTVSRALRNDETILPTTRAKVFQVASELGYRPKLRRAQRTEPQVGDPPSNNPPVIAVYAHEPKERRWDDGSHDPGHTMLSGISAAAAARGAQIYFQSVQDGEIEDVLDQPGKSGSRLRVRDCAGAILLYLHKPSAIRKLTSHLPCVSLVNRYSAVDLDTVGVDTDKSLGELMQRLLELGHRRVGFFNGRPRGPWVEDRFATYVKTLTRHRLTFDPEIVLGVYDAKRLEAHHYAQQLCSATRNGVTAWVCSNDLMGYEACRSLREAGFNVPGDVSVTGFDGVKPPAGQPALSTVVSPLEELGEAGVIRMMAKLKDPTMATRTVLLRCRLSEGQTIGPARPSQS